MGKFYESKFYQYALLAFELMKLNVVAVVCSLPVVTIGAVWTGMYAAVSELSNDSGSTVKNFFAGFKKNFLRSTLHWLLLLLFFVFKNVFETILGRIYIIIIIVVINPIQENFYSCKLPIIIILHRLLSKKMG